MGKSRDNFNRDKFLDKRTKGSKKSTTDSKRIRIKDNKYLEFLEEGPADKEEADDDQAV